MWLSSNIKICFYLQFFCLSSSLFSFSSTFLRLGRCSRCLFASSLPIKVMDLSSGLKVIQFLLRVFIFFGHLTPGLRIILVYNSLATSSSQKVLLMKPLLRKGGSTLLFRFSVSIVLFLYISSVILLINSL